MRNKKGGGKTRKKDREKEGGQEGRRIDKSRKSVRWSAVPVAPM